MVEIEEDLSEECSGYFIVESAEVMCAESEEDIITTLKEMLGEHLVTYSIRKATWKEKRAYIAQQKLRATLCS